MSWWMWELAGVVTLGVGIVVLAEPGKSLQALAVLTGIYLLLDSLLAFATAVARDTERRELPAIHGVISLIAGLLLVRRPSESITLIAVVIGIWLLVRGCIAIVAAFERDHAALRIAMGAVQAAAGVVVIAQPHIGYNALALVTGISFALQGILLMALGWTMRAHGEPSTSPLRPGPAAS